eukprot:TRINITY_DN67015_c8_g2_i2.p1 TRINITY_DN67015_c8_g2~~TRINITY_DN67015_c8_g2_i2.p1  ORF type:complete len:363 (+),score=147.26 TRINITY_DN67015_c8_g2_i2:144-1091(+)
MNDPKPQQQSQQQQQQQQTQKQQQQSRVGVLLFSATSISPDESVFIRSGVEQDVRNDGRGRLDHRDFDVELAPLPQSNGSARLRLGRTQVLVGVNAELEEPDSERPGRGKVVCVVKSAPSLAGKGSRKRDVALSGALQQIIADSDAIDTEALCVIPGKQCWVIYVDVVVVDSDGNVLDAIVLAAKAALGNTLIPSLRVIDSEEGDGKKEIELSEDPFDAQPLDCSRLPVAVSLTKIGSCVVVDATSQEEQCAAACLTFAIDADGNVCSTSKTGPGAVSPSGVIEMLKYAGQIAQQLHKKISAAVDSDSSERDDRM